MKTVAFHTLGCKLNFSETSTIARQMEQEGLQRVDFDGVSDIYVINTCSVTENADKECRMLVRQIQRKAPEASVVIMGCYAQLKPYEIASIEGVDLVLGAAEKFNLAAHLKELNKSEATKVYSCDIDTVGDFNSAYSIGDRTRSFLKVQDGCDYTCSFCTIPMARGGSRSDQIENVIEKAREIAAMGAKEIVLTGVNLGDFKYEKEGKKINFYDLVQALDAVEGIARYRISSIEPNLLTTAIIEFVAQSKRFMPHFHIPLQSGSNKILGLMRRRYQRELYVERVAAIKAAMPHACIGVDVIVGFPGETEADFQETYQFLYDLDISYLHVFTYSERPNTLAVELAGVVPVAIRKERNQLLRQLSIKKMNFFREQFIGQQRSVLFESEGKDGNMEGFTDNYLKITMPYNESWCNTIQEKIAIN
jgi:threonylcarbamoyladenosine tRNA methylthiotransferase MtaB